MAMRCSATLLLPVMVLASQVLATASDAVLDIDFSKSVKEVHSRAKGSFDGVLPEGCVADFPGWNSSVASSKLMTEGDRTFLRLSVAKLDASVQFNWPLQGLQIPGSYSLTVSCRLPASDLSLSFRQLPAPYKTFWSAGIPVSDGAWCERTFVITLDEKSEFPLGLFLYPGLGDCDLAAIRIVGISTDEMAKSLLRPAKDCANFFRNSRFPLGLQTGWNVSREFTGGVVDTDPASPGPSGFPSMKLASDKPITLYSEPFQTADPFGRNFVSFACKGSGEWKLSVICPKPSGRSREIATKVIYATQEWKTESLEVKLDDRAKVARAFTLRISGTGTLNIDSLQAWANAPEDRAYVSQGECEVALGFPTSAFSDTRIQFVDEEPSLDFCVTGAMEGATLKLKAVTVSGEEKALPDIKLGRSFFARLVGAEKSSSQRGSFRYDVFPQTVLGQFRIEAHVERDGKRVSPFNEILVTRLKRPVHLDEDAPDSPFGCHFMASPITVRTMKAAGVNWARFHDAGTDYIGWFHLEPEKGQWAFRDDAIATFRDNKMKIFAGLQTAPKWGSLYIDSGKKDFNGYFDRYFQPRNLDEWSNYVRTVTRRYKGVIDDYFVWNEPWGASFWHATYDAAKKEYQGGPTAAADYAKLSIAAYAAAKEGNPAAKVSGFNSYGSESGRTWTKGVFDGGAYPGCDLVDYHFYTPADQGFPGDPAQEAYADAIDYIKEQVPSFAKPVYMSEGQANSTGSAGGGGFGLYKHALTWANDENPILNGDKTCRYVIANLAAGAAKVFLYTAHGYETLAVTPSFLTLVGPDGYPQVELAAFSNMAWHLEDSTFVRCVPLNDAVCAYLFQGKGASTAVISGLRAGRFDIPASTEFTVSDLFGNPVQGAARFEGCLLYVRSGCGADRLQELLRGK